MTDRETKERWRKKGQVVCKERGGRQREREREGKKKDRERERERDRRREGGRDGESEIFCVLILLG